MKEIHHPVEFGANAQVPKGLIVVVKPDLTIMVVKSLENLGAVPLGTVIWTDPETHADLLADLRSRGEAQWIA